MFEKVDHSKFFRAAFGGAGGPTLECHCGKYHVAMESDWFVRYGDEDAEAEMKGLLAREKDGDENLVLHYDCDDIRFITVNGKDYVDVCDCEGWKPYMKFIVQERINIYYFLHDSVDNFIKEAKWESDRAIIMEKLTNVF